MAQKKGIVLGTTRLSGIQHEEVVRTAFQKGIRAVDTASSYGGGASELLLGKVPNILTAIRFGFYLLFHHI